jgi:hypothetical protein
MVMPVVLLAVGALSCLAIKSARSPRKPATPEVAAEARTRA